MRKERPNTWSAVVLALSLLLATLLPSVALADSAPATTGSPAPQPTQSSQAQAPTWRDLLQSITLTDQLDDNENPTNSLTTVAVSDMTTIFLVRAWRGPGAPAVEYIKVLDPAGNLLDQSALRPFAFDSSWWNRFYIPTRQAGDYRFQVYVNDTLVTTLVLTVIDPAAGVTTAHAVITGDAKVSATTLNHAARIFEQLSYPLVTSDLGGAGSPPVNIHLYSSDATYREGLLRIGVGAGAIDATVNGAAAVHTGANILVNLSAGESLANLLTHEYTHYVLYRQNVVGLPLWLNEGLAWREGLRARDLSEPTLLVDGMRSRLTLHVLDVLAKSQLQPLTGNGTGSDAPPADYNYEAQDWLALRYLEQQHGLKQIRNYLAQLRTAGHTTAFSAAFHTTPTDFEHDFNQHLQSLAARPFPGAKIALRFAGGGTGALVITPPGSTQDAVMQITNPGDYTVTISAAGEVEIDDPSLKVAYVSSKEAPNPTVLFVGFVPDRPVPDLNGNLTAGGFAIKAVSGEVFYSNSYTWVSGKSAAQYWLAQPFGLRLLDVQTLSH